MIAISSVWNYGISDDVITENIASGVSIPENSKKAVQRGRLEYDIDDLKKIVSSTIFDKEPYKKWIFYLCLYTGARLEEICQLNKSDIKNIEGVMCVDITTLDDEGNKIEFDKQLKNSGSIREVPIHKKIIELGFLEYVKSVADGKLFPELTPFKGKYGANYSKWYGRQRKITGITSSKKVFHSLRHTFKTLCVKFHIEKDVRTIFMGHIQEDDHDGYGSYPIETLKEYIDRIVIDI